MANLNPTPNKTTTDALGGIFSATEAALVIGNITTSRAILRAVGLAARAQFEGSVIYENNNTGRWQPAVDAACVRLEAVRDVLMQTAAAPSVDWYTSLTLLEVMGAALWHGNSCSQADKLEEVELESLAQVVIESLDYIMDECLSTGVFDMARTAKAAAVH